VEAAGTDSACTVNSSLWASLLVELGCRDEVPRLLVLRLPPLADASSLGHSDEVEFCRLRRLFSMVPADMLGQDTKQIGDDSKAMAMHQNPMSNLGSMHQERA
jgi:hypothetical protein